MNKFIFTVMIIMGFCTSAFATEPNACKMVAKCQTECNQDKIKSRCWWLNSSDDARADCMINENLKHSCSKCELANKVCEQEKCLAGHNESCEKPKDPAKEKEEKISACKAAWNNLITYQVTGICNNSTSCSNQSYNSIIIKSCFGIEESEMAIRIQILDDLKKEYELKISIAEKEYKSYKESIKSYGKLLEETKKALTAVLKSKGK